MLVCKDLKKNVLLTSPVEARTMVKYLLIKLKKKITYKPYGTEDGELLVCKDF